MYVVWRPRKNLQFKVHPRNETTGFTVNNLLCSFKPCCKINNSNSKISSSIILGSNLNVFSWCFYSWTFYHLLHSVKIILGLHFHTSLCDATILWCFVTKVTLLIWFLDQIFACFREVVLFLNFLSHVGQW